MSANASPSATSGYTGRFAPSPTGKLHYGSLLAALASFLDARAAHGTWLVRIEDIDPPREMPGAADDILRTLEAFELHWDGSVRYQSQQLPRYQALLDALISSGYAYACSCSRKDISARTDGLYDRWCLQHPPAQSHDTAIRLLMPDGTFVLEDGIQTARPFDLKQHGDVVIRRKDGPFAYQLAVVADDEDQRITHIVRGSDLLDSTPWQYQLQRYLGFSHPAWSHIPVILNEQGQKLSKQNLAPALKPAKRSELIAQALRHLQQPLPDELQHAPVSEQLAFAIRQWQPSAIPAVMELPPLESSLC